MSIPKAPADTPPECEHLYEEYAVLMGEYNRCEPKLIRVGPALVPNPACEVLKVEASRCLVIFQNCVREHQPVTAPPKACLIATFIPIPLFLMFLRGVRTFLPVWFVNGYYALSSMILS